jgi:Kef-type K+ transport system membrane component KefB
VLGLVILAAVSGVIAEANQGSSLAPTTLAFIVIKALGFLVLALGAGALFSRRLFLLAASLRARGVLLALGLSLCFFLSWIASAIGLAPLVGAFAAGLVLEEAHYRGFVGRGEHGLEELVQPISSFLVPIFFVLMGARTDLRSFTQPGVLVLAAALTVAAVVGKQACSLGVVQKGVDRLSVGLGMIPRGEVGLIFADMGRRLTIGDEPVIDDATFSAVVAMVIVTTMITPPALKWSLGRKALPPSAVASDKPTPT